MCIFKAKKNCQNNLGFFRLNSLRISKDNIEDYSHRKNHQNRQSGSRDMQFVDKSLFCLQIQKKIKFPNGSILKINWLESKSGHFFENLPYCRGVTGPVLEIFRRKMKAKFQVILLTLVGSICLILHLLIDKIGTS